MTDQQDLKARLPELPEPWGFARVVDGQLFVSVGSIKPNDRSGGYATPWAAMFDVSHMRAYALEYKSHLRASDEPAAFAAHGKSEEFGPVLLSEYVGSMEVIRGRVMEKARREGFTGDFVQRMAELDWWIEPLYSRPQLPAGVPDGWQLVPIEPTPEMLRAGFLSESEGFDIETPADAPGLVYRAMLAAAPQPDSQKSGEENTHG